MKTTINIFCAFLFFSFIFSSCNKNDNTVEPNSNTDTYGGVLVGSSGYYTLNLKSESSTLKLVFDGVEYNFTNSTAFDINENVNLEFTNQSITINFSKNAQTGDVSINFSIPGHTIVAAIYPSVNGDLELYTGTSETYDGEDLFYKSTFNLTVTATNFEALEKVLVSGADDIQAGDVLIHKGTVVSNTETELVIRETSITINGETEAPEGGAQTITLQRFGTSMSFGWEDEFSSAITTCYRVN